MSLSHCTVLVSGCSGAKARPQVGSLTPNTRVGPASYTRKFIALSRISPIIHHSKYCWCGVLRPSCVCGWCAGGGALVSCFCVCRLVVGCALPHSLATSSCPSASLWIVLWPFCRAHNPRLADTVQQCLLLPATGSLIPCGVMPKCYPFP